MSSKTLWGRMIFRKVFAISLALTLVSACSTMSACGLLLERPQTTTTPQPPTNIENQTPPEVSQPELPPEETATGTEWSTVKTFTGKESKDTSPFNISGTKWRIIWTVAVQNPEYATFEILVYSQDTPNLLTKRISYSKANSGDTAYIYEGGHDYYLKVLAANLSNWTITVEDYTDEQLSGPMQITYINYTGLTYLQSIDTGELIIVEPNEYVEIKNLSDSPQNITGWVLKNLTNGAAFTFPTFKPCSCEWYDNFTDCIENCYPPSPCIIEPHKGIRVYTHQPHYESGGFCFYYGLDNIWDNETPDTAVLYNLEGQEVSRKSYVIPTKQNVTSGK